MDAKPTIPEVIPLIRAYKSVEENRCGGILHIVLDDGNVKDSDVDYCVARASEAGDKEGLKIANLLRAMSQTQRRKLSRMFYA